MTWILIPRDFEDVDPIDRQLAGGRTERSDRWRLRSRLALGLSLTPRPGLLLLLLGMALGSQGLGLLSPGVLTFLDPGVSMALAALGAFVGMEVTLRRPHDRTLLFAASLESGVTLVIVFGGFLALHAVRPAEIANFSIAALMLGICASSSATTAEESPSELRAIGIRIGDLDDVLPIVLGGLALAWIHHQTPLSAAWFVGQTTLIGATIGLAGWLLVGQTASLAEQRTFTIGTLLLLGGFSAYLSVSALFAGLLAGAIWGSAGGDATERISRDMRYLQHPLLVLLLLVAGARLPLSRGTLDLVTLYVLFRVIGKLAGGWLAARVSGRDQRPHLGSHLISPGIVAIAFALNTVDARGGQPDGIAVLTVAVLGSLVSEALALIVHRTEEA